MHASDLERITVEGVGRIYTDGDAFWPSVSTVLSVPDKPDALIRWKENTENAEEITSYKQNRGTLGHEMCLQELVPEEDGAPVQLLWGKEEENSTEWINQNGWRDRWESDKEWIKTGWEKIKRIMDIDYVIDVECYVVNTDIGYSGQFDLLYADTDGKTVLGDVKTGKYVYEKNKIQSSAYAKAVPMPVDRAEILRMNPDMADWEVSSSNDWNRGLDELFSIFTGYRGKLPDSKIENIVDRAAQGDGLRESGVDSPDDPED